MQRIQGGFKSVFKDFTFNVFTNFPYQGKAVSETGMILIFSPFMPGDLVSVVWT